MAPKTTKRTSTIKTIVQKLTLDSLQAKFSNLLEPKGFNEADENRKYSISATLSESQAAELEILLVEALEKAYEMYASEVPAAERRKLSKAAVPISVDYDRNKEPTGLALIKANRAERLGPPLVVDRDGKRLERKFVAIGSKVRLVVDVASYKAPTGTVGLTLQLLGVVVLEEKSNKTKELSPQDLGFNLKDGEDLANSIF